MQNSAFDTALPPLAGIDRYAVITAENPTMTYYFRKLRDAVNASRSFRNIGAIVMDTNTHVMVFCQK